MLSKNKAKYIQSLRLKKNRQKNNAFIVEGEKIVLELLHSNRFDIELLCATDLWQNNQKQVLKRFASILHSIDEKELKKISNLHTPNHVLAVVRQKNQEHSLLLAENHLYLYLDTIQDPGNMGTILRIADWFGIPSVLCSPSCVDVHNPKVVQATMGAFLRVNVLEMEFDTLKKANPNFTYYGAALDGEDVFKIEKQKNAVLIIGNESKGIDNNLKKQLDHKIKILAGKNGGAESLNASVATGIICAAFFNA